MKPWNFLIYRRNNTYLHILVYKHTPAGSIFFPGSTAPVGLGYFIVGVLVSHSDTPHSVGLPWTSDRPDAETSTCQHKTLTTDIYAHGGIRTCNPIKREAADPRLAPRGQWDRLKI
jgi:hypothetical protein